MSDIQTVFVPSRSNFKDIDRALLPIRPSRRAPVLFLIQMTTAQSGHSVSDADFKNLSNPLYTAFVKASNGIGRKQFLWVVDGDPALIRRRKTRKLILGSCLNLK